MIRLYQPNEYILLSAQLTEQEMICIEYCQIYSDCAADGECALQERVADIIVESEVTNAK